MGTEHDISVLAFPAANVDDHASAVDIGELQAGQLGAPYPVPIERHLKEDFKIDLGRNALPNVIEELEKAWAVWDQ